MKKILLIIISLFALTAIFTACEEEEDQYYAGVAIYVSDTDYYILDPGVDGDIKTSRADLEIEVSIDGELVTTLTTVDSAVSYSFSQADLGNMETGDDVEVRFGVELPDGPAAHYITFEVPDPLTLTCPSNFPPMDSTYKMYITLAEDCTAPTTVELTRQINSGTPEVIVSPSNIYNDSIDIPILATMSGDTITYEFTLSNANGTLVSSHVIEVVIKRAWDFEGYEGWTTDFAPWTLVDNDGFSVYTSGSIDYPGEGEAGSWRIFDFETTDPAEPEGWEAHSGTKYAFCVSSVPQGGMGNDDWMISDNFDIGEEEGWKLTLYAKTLDDSWGAERLVVIVVDNADGSETILTDDPYTEVPTDWTKYSWTLTGETPDVNCANKNITVKIGCVSNDAFILMVDDFEIEMPGGEKLHSNDFEYNTSTKQVRFDRTIK